MKCPECGNFYAHNGYCSQFKRLSPPVDPLRFVKVAPGIEWLIGDVGKPGAMLELQKLIGVPNNVRAGRICEEACELIRDKFSEEMAKHRDEVA
jgi:hypothetical protein